MAVSNNLEELDSMKYAELQKIAKDVGIKANMKAAKLVQAIKDHYAASDNKENEPTEEAKEELVKEVPQEPEQLEKPVSAKNSSEKKPKQRKARKGRKGGKRKSKEEQESSTDEDSSKDSSSSEAEKSPEAKSSRPQTPELLVQGVKMTPLPSPMKNKTPGPTEAKSTRPPTPDLLVEGVKMTPIPTPVKNKTPGSTGAKANKKTSLSAKRKIETPVGNTTVAMLKEATPASSNGGGRKRKRTKTPESKVNTTFEVEEPTVEMPSEERKAKRRRGTFEIEKTTPECTPTEAPKSSETKAKQRRGTFEIEKKSPGAKDIIDNLTENMDVDAMKASLLSAIEKKVEEKKAQQPAEGSSHIPRFAAFLAQRKQEGAGSSIKKPITPGNKNWDKIHKRHFNKMESIDTYLAKKRQRTDEITASVKKAKLLAEQTRKAMETVKNHRTPTHKGAKIVRPIKAGLTFKTPAHSGVPFKPSVTSTTKLNINFAGSKTPSFTAVTKPTPGNRKSLGKNEASKENLDRKKSIGGPTLASATPLKPTTKQTPPKKAATTFDLKASLSKPLSWKPHIGKLQPWERKDVKTHKPQTKEDRLKAAKAHRAEKKSNLAMQRRGINA